MFVINMRDREVCSGAIFQRLLQ